MYNLHLSSHPLSDSSLVVPYHGVAQCHGVEVVEHLLAPHQLVVELVIRHGRRQEGVAVCYEDVENCHYLQNKSVHGTPR